MLYYLSEYLGQEFKIPGIGVFQYISFRAAITFITALLISLIFGKKIIDFLRKKQMGESVRDLGLIGQKEKEGTPTMGGIIIILATLIPVFIFSKFINIYIVMLVVTTLWMGMIGFLDDYLKKYKNNKDGLAGKFKVLGQVGLGFFIGYTMYFHPSIVIKENIKPATEINDKTARSLPVFSDNIKATKSTVPFMKNNELDYNQTLFWMDEQGSKEWAWLAFIIIIIFIVSAVSNGANLTDGIDGLAAGTSAIITATLAIFAYFSGNIITADYLNIMYIPNMGEVVVFSAALMGALIGFLWYNTFPAQVFMGDTGSLAIGGVIAVLAIIVRKELLIPILCGVFFAESLSVILQVFYFKITKRYYGEGRRIFLMSPLHHHYQKMGIHESKIVQRFYIVGLLLAAITIITLKIR